MNKNIATLATLVTLAVPATADAIAGMGWCKDSRSHTVTVIPGDNLTRISERVYGDSTMIDKIAIYNDIKDKDIIKAGQVLEMPGLMLDYWRPFSATRPGCRQHSINSSNQYY